jgi:hypothetical protein
MIIVVVVPGMVVVVVEVVVVASEVVVVASVVVCSGSVVVEVLSGLEVVVVVDSGTSTQLCHGVSFCSAWACASLSCC